MRASDPTGLHRVLDEAVVLPQAAQRLDTRKELWPDEVRIRVERLNLDAASRLSRSTRIRTSSGQSSRVVSSRWAAWGSTTASSRTRCNPVGSLARTKFLLGNLEMTG